MSVYRILAALLIHAVVASTSSAAVQSNSRDGDSSARSEVKSALENAISAVAEEQQYRLAYQLPPDVRLEWKCEHATSNRTRMAGTSDSMTSRTTWKTSWLVKPPNQAGLVEFDSQVLQYYMWQKRNDDAPIEYNSETSSSIPEEFQALSDNLKPRPSTFAVSASGKVVKHESTNERKPIGFAEIVVPLPEEPIAVGHRWYVNNELIGTDHDFSKVRVDVRCSYELTRVAKNKAYISFRTEVLTPGVSPAVRSQIIQNLTSGFVVFDLEKGTHIFRETQWDEKVQAFRGADSYLLYKAKTIEELQSITPVNEVVVVDSLKSTEASREATILSPITGEKDKSK